MTVQKNAPWMSGTGSWYQCTDCDQLPKAADLDRTQKHSYRSTHIKW